MVPELAKEFTYQVGWRSRGRHPGRHVSAQRGLGMDFVGHAPLIAYPDPRRIDLRLSLRDPMEQVFVRIYNQRSATPIFVACDLSGSMGFSGHTNKLKTAAEITASAAQSASRINDPFGFIGFDHVVREDWISLPSVRVQAAYALADQLQHYRPAHVDGNGLLDVAQHLPRERSLVLLVSDFHMPLEIIEEALILMQRHHVVPIVLWDAAEYKAMPEFGLTHVTDSETGEKRTLLLRKGTHARIQAAFAERHAALTALFMRYDLPPFFIEQGFDADALTEYFYQFVTA
ncbi:DUF58 domain-containing protein [Methylobacillus gramineus]|uniref:DUF58 domain-containing protein n=1 Tax=Methylobacillus gramineus TaxID=755169 RepID=UPI001CFF54EE|nr:DUF58 domain-containing protein [Methylobacillus gramineus]MCB5183863.1 DUF58 domain-containing protein [Methylobacillus gramineus]